MYKMHEEMRVETRHNLRGGTGDPTAREILSPEELGHRAELLNVMTLHPGESVGEHAHTENAELYFILRGNVTVSDGSERRVLKAGDAEFCCGGNTHAIFNHTDEDADFLALILPNR